jgi:predicted transcriptional regulator
MITIADIVSNLNSSVLAGSDKLQRPVKGAYASDLLSDVMGKAREGELWITMQTHKNIIAVASLKDLSAILIVNGGKPDEDTLATAQSEGVVILGTEARSFSTCGRLYKLMEGDALV